MKAFFSKHKKSILIVTLLSFATYRHNTYTNEILRQTYITKLMSYLSTPYVWGGESHNGIDCSGLVRTAFHESLQDIGWSYLHPQFIGVSYWLKKVDFRAKELAELPSLFKPLQTIESINKLDPKILNPGDLAVVEDGSHVMAYLGRGDWIEANKSRNRVIIVHIPELDMNHYKNSVTLYRWRQL